MPSFACEERQREDAGRCSVCLRLSHKSKAL
jgi:hypothetical protein